MYGQIRFLTFVFHYGMEGVGAAGVMPIFLKAKSWLPYKLICDCKRFDRFNCFAFISATSKLYELASNLSGTSGPKNVKNDTHTVKVIDVEAIHSLSGWHHLWPCKKCRTYFFCKEILRYCHFDQETPANIFMYGPPISDPSIHLPTKF